MATSKKCKAQIVSFLSSPYGDRLDAKTKDYDAFKGLEGDALAEAIRKDVLEAASELRFELASERSDLVNGVTKPLPSATTPTPAPAPVAETPAAPAKAEPKPLTKVVTETAPEAPAPEMAAAESAWDEAVGQSDASTPATWGDLSEEHRAKWSKLVAEGKHSPAVAKAVSERVYREQVAKDKALKVSPTQQENEAVRDLPDAGVARTIRQTTDPIANDEHYENFGGNAKVAKELDGRVTAALDGDAPLQDVLDAVVDLHPNPMVKAIAEAIGKLGLSTDLHLDESLPENVTGRYYVHDNRIALGNTNAANVFHEIVHAATHHVIKLGQTTKQYSTPEQRRAVMAVAHLSSLMDDVKAIGKSRFYAFTDLHEFVAEASSNPEFQQFLASVRSDGTPLAPSLWQRFVTFVRGILGLDDRHQTMLDTVLDAVPSLFPTQEQLLAQGDGTFYNNASTASLASLEALAQTGMEHAGTLDEGYTQRTGVSVAAPDMGARLKHLATENSRRLGVTMESLWRNVGTTQYQSTISYGVKRVSDLIAAGTEASKKFLSTIDGEMRAWLRESDKKVLDDVNVALALARDTLTGSYSQADVDAMMDGDVVVRNQTFDGRTSHQNDAIPIPKLAARGVISPEQFVNGIKDRNGKVIKLPAMMENGKPSHTYQLYLHAIRSSMRSASEMYNADVTNLANQRQRISDLITDTFRLNKEARGTASAMLFKVANAVQKLHTLQTTVEDEEVATQHEQTIAAVLDAMYASITGNDNEAEVALLTEHAGLSADEVKQYGEIMRKALPRSMNLNEFARKMKASAQQYAEFEARGTDSKRRLIESVMSGYVPDSRPGKYMLRTEFHAADGTEVELREDYERVQPRIFNDDLTALKDLHADMMKDYANLGEFTVMARPKGTKGDFVPTQVEAIVRPPREAPRVQQGVKFIDPIEQIAQLKSLGVELPEKVRRRLITGLTRAGDATRSRLRRVGYIGASMDYRRAMADQFNGNAAAVGRRLVASALEDAMRRGSEWWSDGRHEISGLEDELAAAKKSGNAAAIHVAQQALDTAKRQFSGQQDTNIETAFEYAHNLAHDYQFGGGDDIQSDKLRDIRSVTSVAQLGLDMAKAITNTMSIAAHTLPALASYSHQTGFGGGFGARQSFAALSRAATAIAAYVPTGMKRLTHGIGNNIEFLQAAVDAAAKAQDQTHKGYSLASWQFLLREAMAGELQAQQYNALQSRAGGSTGRFDQVAHRAMSLFSTTEEFNRMVTALASYELFHQQAQEAGMKGADLDKYASDKAIEMVMATQGRYDKMNRPRMFREGVLSLVYMYKTFAVTSLELMRNMDAKGRALYFGILWAMSGLKGLPLFEELTTLFDWISRKTGFALGVTKGNAEREFRMFLKSYHPAMEPVMMHGVMDQLLGLATFGAANPEVFGRGGVTVGIPGISALKPGANLWEELGKSLGASAGAFVAGVKSAGALAHGDILRAGQEAPIAVVKNMAEGFAYAKYDNVLNKRGQVVTKSPGIADALMRSIGWSPLDVKSANERVALEELTREYTKELSTRMLEEYRRAYVNKDAEGMQEVLDAAKEHNVTFKGSALELQDFAKKAKKAAREADLTLEQRTLKSLPKSQRQATLLTEGE